MNFNYYPDVDKYFKTLYNMNQDWFKTRGKLTDKDLQKLFQIFLRIDDNLIEIKKIIAPEQVAGGGI